MSSLRRITDKEFAERTVRDMIHQSGYDSVVWMARGAEVTLVAMYYSESETGILRIQMVSNGKKSLSFFTGNLSDVVKASRLWASFWDMILPRYSSPSRKTGPGFF